MGLRSWLTPVKSKAELRSLKAAIRRNPDAFGIQYVIDVRQDVPLLPRGLVVAWAGDGNWSLTEHMPEKYHADTVPLPGVIPVRLSLKCRFRRHRIRSMVGRAEHLSDEFSQ